MKKILLSIFASLMLISCGGSDKPKLYVYSWADYIPSEVYEQFEEETGIHIVEDIYSSNEEMYTKIKAGGDGYDILLPSSDYVEIMSNQDMLLKLDLSKLSNYNNIDTLVIDKMKESGDIINYGVPYMMVPTIIAVNKKEVGDYKKDYSIFEREDLAGRMTLLDDMREVMTAALAVNGYKQNEVNEETMDKAKNTILKWKKNIAKFDSESFGKGFANGDFVVVQGYPDNIYTELTDEQKANTDFFIPEVGGLSAIDSFVISKNSKHVEEAYKFIEFILRPDIAAKISTKFNLPSINVKARELAENAYIYEFEDLKKTQLLINIKDKVELENKYWQSIMIEN